MRAPTQSGLAGVLPAAAANGAVVMLLIDADNVSTAVMEAALQRSLARHAAVHIRRAYCTAEKALAERDTFLRLGVRPMVNFSAGKNSNDIAMAADAAALAASGRVQVAVIVSSDADFSPLVLALREQGCRVEGFGQAGKTGEALAAHYDYFETLAARAAVGASARQTAAADDGAAKPARRAGRRAGAQAPDAPARSTPSKPPTPPTPPTPPKSPERSTPAAPSARSAPKAPARSRGAAAAPAAPARSTQLPAATTAAAALPAPASAPRAPGTAPAEVERVLAALPALRAGRTLALNDAVVELRAQGLLSKSGSSSRLFAKLSPHFELSPADKPSKLRYTGPSP